MDICFIILGHQNPDHIAVIARHLLDAKQSVVIHYDAKSSEEEYRYLVNKYTQERNIHFAPRVAVEWGTWSLVKATLNSLETIKANHIQPDYVNLLSGNDYPIRPLSKLIQFLTRNRGREFIESWPADHYKWVAVGKQRGRYLYRHPVSSKKHYYLFTLVYQFQRLLNLKRKFVNGCEPYIGSQWWTLTWSTCAKILRLVDTDPKIIRFFKKTHVPDEMFFQTLVNTFVSKEKIANKKLTLCEFDDFGKAVVYKSRHFKHLISQPFYFARKVMPESKEIIAQLNGVVSGKLDCPSFKDQEFGIMNKTIKDFYDSYRV